MHAVGPDGSHSVIRVLFIDIQKLLPPCCTILCFCELYPPLQQPSLHFSVCWRKDFKSKLFGRFYGCLPLRQEDRRIAWRDEIFVCFLLLGFDLSLFRRILTHFLTMLACNTNQSVCVSVCQLHTDVDTERDRQTD